MKKVFREKNAIILANDDREAFLYALENPPKPNRKLKQALKHHKKLIRSNRQAISDTKWL